MSNLLSELSNYSNHLSPSVKEYFIAGARISSSDSNFLLKVADLEWITSETKMSEIIQYLDKVFDKEKQRKQPGLNIIEWLRGKYATIIATKAIAGTMVKNIFTWNPDISVTEIITLFYLGLILNQQNRILKTEF
jgi:hypothetical protein